MFQRTAGDGSKEPCHLTTTQTALCEDQACWRLIDTPPANACKKIPSGAGHKHQAATVAPDSDQRHSNEDRCSNRANDICPNAAAVHEAIKGTEAPLNERAFDWIEDDLKMSLCS